MYKLERKYVAVTQGSEKSKLAPSKRTPSKAAPKDCESEERKKLRQMTKNYFSRVYPAATSLLLQPHLAPAATAWLLQSHLGSCCLKLSIAATYQLIQQLSCSYSYIFASSAIS